MRFPCKSQITIHPYNKPLSLKVTMIFIIFILFPFLNYFEQSLLMKGIKKFTNFKIQQWSKLAFSNLAQPLKRHKKIKEKTSKERFLFKLFVKQLIYS